MLRSPHTEHTGAIFEWFGLNIGVTALNIFKFDNKILYLFKCIFISFDSNALLKVKQIQSSLQDKEHFTGNGSCFIIIGSFKTVKFG